MRYYGGFISMNTNAENTAALTCKKKFSFKAPIGNEKNIIKNDKYMHENNISGINMKREKYNSKNYKLACQALLLILLLSVQIFIIFLFIFFLKQAQSP